MLLQIERMLRNKHNNIWASRRALAAMAARRGQLHFGRSNEPGWNPGERSAEFTLAARVQVVIISSFEFAPKAERYRGELEFAFTLHRVSRLPASLLAVARLWPVWRAWLSFTLQFVCRRRRAGWLAGRPADELAAF